MQYTGLKSVLDYASRINGSYYSYKADIRYIYKVGTTAWYNVMIQVCSREDIYGYVTGTVTFHNPYGYLEAKNYGMLPVEVSSASYPPPLCHSYSHAAALVTTVSTTRRGPCVAQGIRVLAFLLYAVPYLYLFRKHMVRFRTVLVPWIASLQSIPPLTGPNPPPTNP